MISAVCSAARVRQRRRHGASPRRVRGRPAMAVALRSPVRRRRCRFVLPRAAVLRYPDREEGPVSCLVSVPSSSNARSRSAAWRCPSSRSSRCTSIRRLRSWVSCRSSSALGHDAYAFAVLAAHLPYAIGVLLCVGSPRVSRDRLVVLSMWLRRRVRRRDRPRHRGRDEPRPRVLRVRGARGRVSVRVPGGVRRHGRQRARSTSGRPCRRAAGDPERVHDALVLSWPSPAT